MRAGEIGPVRSISTGDRLALPLWVAAPIAVTRWPLRKRDWPAQRWRRSLSALSWRSSCVWHRPVLLAQPAAVPMGYLLGRLAVGGLTGIGMAIALLATGVATRRLITALPGIVLAGATNLGASVAAYELFYGSVRCLQ
jgi:hypothetical protein